MGFGDSFANVYNAVAGARQRDEALSVQKKSNELEQTFRVLGAVQANNERLDRIQADRDALLQQHTQAFSNMQAANLKMSLSRDISPVDYARDEVIFNAAADGYRRVSERLEFLTAAQDRIRNDGDQLSAFLNRFSVISDIPGVQQSMQQANQQAQPQRSPVPVGMQAIQSLNQPQQGGEFAGQRYGGAAYPTQFGRVAPVAAAQDPAMQHPNIPGVTGPPAPQQPTAQSAVQQPPLAPAGVGQRPAKATPRSEAILGVIKGSIPYPAEIGEDGGVVVKTKTALEAEDARAKLTALQEGLQLTSPLPVRVEDPQSEESARLQLEAGKNKVAGEAAARAVSSANSPLNKVGIVLSMDESGGPRFTDPAGNPPSLINAIKLSQDQAEEDDEEDRAEIAPEGANQHDAAVAMKMIASAAAENPAVAKAAVRDLGLSIEAYAKDLESYGDLLPDLGGEIGVSALGVPYQKGQKKPNAYVVNLFGRADKDAAIFADSVVKLAGLAGTEPGDAVPSIRMPNPVEAAYQYRKPSIGGERPEKESSVSADDGLNAGERKLIGYLTSLAGDDGRLDEATSIQVAHIAGVGKRAAPAWRAILHPKAVRELPKKQDEPKRTPITPASTKPSGILHNFPYMDGEDRNR